jgi:hypothetical protein
MFIIRDSFGSVISLYKRHELYAEIYAIKKREMEERENFQIFLKVNIIITPVCL